MAKIYRILNYSGSPVAFRTREKGYLVSGGTMEEPSAILLDENELVEANYASRVFKDGLLFPRRTMPKKFIRFSAFRTGRIFCETTKSNRSFSIRQRTVFASSSQSKQSVDSKEYGAF